MSGPAVCYLLSNYRSHMRAGLDNRRALADAGVPLVEDPADAQVVVIHDEPWSYPDFFRAYPVLRKRHVIAYAVWEPDRLPTDHLRWLRLVDEIWTSSSYCREIMLAAGRPVAVIPHIVEPPQADPAAAESLRARLGLDAGRFVFYAIAKIDERKNIEAGIRAFAAAFPEGGPAYVIRTPSPLAAELAATPDVIAWGGDEASDSDIAALHELGHCFISPHCAEGWGLCISDAMAHGKLVVATGFSGNMDYMNGENALPVDYSLEVIRAPETRGRFGFAVDEEPHWAYVDEHDLSEKMRLAVDRWDELESTRTRARAAVAPFGAKSVVRRMLARLTASHATAADEQ